jgi:hypothetical protein
MIQHKDKKIFIVIGSPGTGKTTLVTKHLPKFIKGDYSIYEDLNMVLYKSKTPEKKLHDLLNEIASLRHFENKRIFVITNQVPNKLMRYLQNPIIFSQTCFLFTSAERSLIDDMPLNFSYIQLLMFRKRLLHSLKKGLKTRPFLVMSKYLTSIERYHK